jgi:Asp-tRNA(Asn)/Glu-tRNA(Gln) amidotransferase A subunit family amidase
VTGPAAPRPHSDGDRVGALAVGPALLAHGAADGPLTGRTFVAKDLIDVAGLRSQAATAAGR